MLVSIIGVADFLSYLILCFDYFSDFSSLWKEYSVKTSSNDVGLIGSQLASMYIHPVWLMISMEVYLSLR